MVLGKGLALTERRLQSMPSPDHFSQDGWLVRAESQPWRCELFESRFHNIILRSSAGWLFEAYAHH